MKEKNIQYFHTYTPVKSAQSERAIRTLMNKISRYWSHTNSFNYIKVLPALIDSINNSINRATKVRPNEINSQNHNVVWQNLYGKYIRKKQNKPKLKIGDLVRISLVKKTFEKSYTRRFSEEIFKIAEIGLSVYAYYILEDLDGEKVLGSFYENELMKV